MSLDNTDGLLSKLSKTNNIGRFIKNNCEAMLPPLHEHLHNLRADKGESAEAIIKRAEIERSYGHQIFKGTKKPSRDKVIQLAFGLELDLPQTQILLKMANYGELYPKIKRDAAIIFCLNQHKSVLETQEILHDLQLNLLGGEKE